VLPSTDWKRGPTSKPEQQRWYAGETISLGIGQGYNNFTMLQLASATATLVPAASAIRAAAGARGGDVSTVSVAVGPGDPMAPLAVRPEHVAVVRQALHGVTQEGTSARGLPGAPYKSGGKTGTAQAWASGQREVQRRQAGRAPARPFAVHRLCAGGRAAHRSWRWWSRTPASAREAAAPIARRVFDYLLLGSGPSEEDRRAPGRPGVAPSASRAAARRLPRACRPPVPAPGGRPAGRAAMSRHRQAVSLLAAPAPGGQGFDLPLLAGMLRWRRSA
jgi:penicillin-binding protein 2